MTETNDKQETMATEAAPAPAAEVAELQRLREENQALRDQLLRRAAEFDNYRKRTQRELLDQFAAGGAEAMRAMLPILDGIERALAAPTGSLEEFRRGIELLHRQLLEAGKKLGLEAIEAVGQTFDPHQHEALEMVETDEAPEHSILSELQRGYRLRERLLRPARVRVARPPRSGEA